MNDLDKYTPTELLKLGDDVVKQHNQIKDDIITLTKEIDDIEETIKDKLKELEALEKLYLDIFNNIEKTKI